MAKDSALLYTQQRLEKIQKEYVMEITNVTVLRGLYIMRLQRDCGCEATGEVCGEGCSCAEIMQQDIVNFKQIKGIT